MNLNQGLLIPADPIVHSEKPKTLQKNPTWLERASVRVAEQLELRRTPDIASEGCHCLAKGEEYQLPKKPVGHMSYSKHPRRCHVDHIQALQETPERGGAPKTTPQKQG